MVIGHWSFVILAGIALLAAASPAFALIKVDIPVSKVYDTAATVVAGEVIAVKADNRVVDVRVTQTFKGDMAAKTLRVQIVEPAGLINDVAAGQPIILFVGDAGGGGLTAVHLADTWLLAERLANVSPPAFRVKQVHNDLKLSFPFKTSALINLVGGLRNSLASAGPWMPTGLRDRGRLNVTGATWMLTGDFNGDRRVDLVVGTSAGVRLFVAGEQPGAAAPHAGYTDRTAEWLPAGLPVDGWRAIGDVNGDGKADLLLKDTLYVSTGAALVASAKLDWPKSGPAVASPSVTAAALLDVTGDKRPDIARLDSTGQLVVLENPGAADEPWRARPPVKLWKQEPPFLSATFGRWDESGGPTVMALRDGRLTRHRLDGDDACEGAEFEWLTGAQFAGYGRPFHENPQAAAMAALDADGDGRPELLALADGDGILLANRGQGVYQVHVVALQTAVIAATTAPASRPDVDFVWTAADLDGDRRDEALVLTETGRLLEIPLNLPAPPATTAPAD